MTTPPAGSPRDFYDAEYHFAQDVERPNESRIHRNLRRLPLEGATYLDLGCGAGWAARLAKHAYRTRRTIGLDFSRTALELAHSHSPGILWIQADGTALPVADASIDALHCDGALEHFPDVQRGIAEVSRILKPGGTGVLIVPNFYVKTEQPMEFRATYWAWKSKLQAAGLKVVKTGVDWGPPLLGAGPARAIKRLAGKVLGLVPFMQYQFVFVVRK